MSKIISCGNCGGSYDDDLPKCPYCGSTNIDGAEKDYMEKLEDVREDLEDLDEIPTEELQTAVKKQAVRLRKILLIIGGLAIILAALYFFFNRPEKRDYKAEYLWQQEHYPELNALYDNGEYDELEELLYELSEDENANLLDWEHNEFISDYILGKSILRYLEWDKEEPLDEYRLINLFVSEWQIKGITLRKEEYTQQEYEALLPYIEVSEADFEVRWKLTEEEYNNFSAELSANRNRYISFDNARDFVKAWVKENR